METGSGDVSIALFGTISGDGACSELSTSTLFASQLNQILYIEDSYIDRLSQITEDPAV